MSVNVTVFPDIFVNVSVVSDILLAVSPLNNVYVKLSPSTSSAATVIVSLSVDSATLATVTSPIVGT